MLTLHTLAYPTICGPMLGHDGTLTEIQHLLICAGLFIWQPAREDSSARVTNPLLAYATIAHATLSCSVPVYVAICRYVLAYVRSASMWCLLGFLYPLYHLFTTVYPSYWQLSLTIPVAGHAMLIQFGPIFSIACCLMREDGKNIGI
jgi:hypothetical protein